MGYLSSKYNVPGRLGHSGGSFGAFNSAPRAPVVRQSTLRSSYILVSFLFVVMLMLLMLLIAVVNPMSKTYVLGSLSRVFSLFNTNKAVVSDTYGSGGMTKLSRVKLKPIVDSASKHYDLPSSLIWAVIKVESDFNPQARSDAGALGLMQLMPETAEEMKVKNPFDPVDNIFGGTKYLSYLHKRFNGNKKLVIAAYNAGPGNVDKYQGVPPFKETKKYVKKVFAQIKQEKKGRV